MYGRGFVYSFSQDLLAGRDAVNKLLNPLVPELLLALLDDEFKDETTDIGAEPAPTDCCIKLSMYCINSPFSSAIFS